MCLLACKSLWMSWLTDTWTYWLQIFNKYESMYTYYLSKHMQLTMSQNYVELGFKFLSLRNPMGMSDNCYSQKKTHDQFPSFSTKQFKRNRKVQSFLESQATIFKLPENFFFFLIRTILVIPLIITHSLAGSLLYTVAWLWNYAC